ncbi:MAG TPA: extracellular solute-binding protein [Terrimesophilobacter sp.]|uniref:ABC transporter substrate-binding protein n=1 Tax=Terrimesophilobacter sp. TaxID=2906435 RepID=UPI002F9450AC
MRFTPTRFKGAIAAVAAAALLLTGCSTTGNSGEETPPNFINVFWKGSEKPGIDAVVAAYKAANPEVEVVVTTADTEQYQATLRTQLSAGTAADVIFLWPADGNPAAIRQIAPGGFVEDLSDRSWVKDYPAAIDELTKVDGKTYLMAPAVTSFGPWYNEDALVKAGLTAPSVWSDVLPFCAAAREKGKTAFGLGAGTLNATQTALYGLVPDLVYGADADHDKTLASGKTTFSTNKGWIEAMDKYQQMNEAGCYNDDPTGISQDEQNKLVASGQALGMLGIGFQLAALRSLAPDTNFVLHPFSGDDDPANDLMTVSNAGGASVNVKAKNKELALEFVDYLASPEGLQIYNDALAGTVPSIPTGVATDDPNLKVITEYLANDQSVHFLNQFWPNARIEQAMYSGVQGMLAGSETPSGVLAAMDAALKVK